MKDAKTQSPGELMDKAKALIRASAENAVAIGEVLHIFRHNTTKVGGEDVPLFLSLGYDSWFAFVENGLSLHYSTSFKYLTIYRFWEQTLQGRWNKALASTTAVMYDIARLGLHQKWGVKQVGTANSWLLYASRETTTACDIHRQVLEHLDLADRSAPVSFKLLPKEKAMLDRAIDLYRDSTEETLTRSAVLAAIVSEWVEGKKKRKLPRAA